MRDLKQTWRPARHGDEGKLCRVRLPNGTLMETGRGWFDITLVRFEPINGRPVCVHVNEVFAGEAAEVLAEDGPSCPYCKNIWTDWDDPFAYLEEFNATAKCNKCGKEFGVQVAISNRWTATKLG